jgi:hypothetical protein
MKQYYYTNGTDRFGPMSLEELKTKEITADTLVWYDGLSEWVKAGSVPELAGLFGINEPPPVENNYGQYGRGFTNTPPMPLPKTWLVESILVTLLCCLPFGIVGIVFAAKVESAYNRGDYDAALQASKEAGKWTQIGFWSGLVFGVIYIILVAIVGASGF